MENLHSPEETFTKWVEVLPISSQTTEMTAKMAVNDFFSRFGYPFQLFSDQGRNFESSLISALCEILQLHRVLRTDHRQMARLNDITGR